MKIKRTYKETSLKRGTSVFCDENTVRTVARQTMMGMHEKGAVGCVRGECTQCEGPAMRKLAAGVEIEPFFSKFQIFEA